MRGHHSIIGHSVHQPILAGLRLAAIVLLTLALAPCHALAQRLSGGKNRRIAALWHAGVCLVAGLRIKVTGCVHRIGPTLYVCNHSSYTDIPVLGVVLNARFVAKRDVATWPGIGFLARLGGTIFVARRRMRSRGETYAITHALGQGGRLILFPEGTSNDGNRVLPFKSAFFAPAEAPINGQWVTVQPVAITYTQMDGLPINRLSRPSVAWYGHMDLMPHLWAFLQLGRVTVHVDVMPPVSKTSHQSRKALAKHCHQLINCISAHRRSEGSSHVPDVAPQPAQLPAEAALERADRMG